MDSIDRAIVSELQRHGRIPNNDLADLVGLSPSPCLRRVRRLEADGVIGGYSAVVDREAVGCAYEPIVWATLTTVTRESMLEFEQAIKAIPSIIEAARMMGQPILSFVSSPPTNIETIYMDERAPPRPDPRITTRHEGRQANNRVTDRLIREAVPPDEDVRRAELRLRRGPLRAMDRQDRSPTRRPLSAD